MNGELYARLLAAVPEAATVKRVMLGLNWSAVQADSIGLCFSPSEAPRTLSWPGTLSGRPAAELAAWLSHWEPADAAVALASLNAAVNAHNPLLAEAQRLKGDAPGHLRVFEHFTAQVQGSRIAVIGRYPGLDQLWRGIPYQCIERRPQPGDLPDTAAEFVLPKADWVFITASSIANKSLPRLLELARDAKVVLMGPSLPWLALWHDYGVDYLAGVRVVDENALWSVVAEGGGTRLFDGAVEYCLHSLRAVP